MARVCRKSLMASYLCFGPYPLSPGICDRGNFTCQRATSDAASNLAAFLGKILGGDCPGQTHLTAADLPQRVIGVDAGVVSVAPKKPDGVLPYRHPVQSLDVMGDALVEPHLVVSSALQAIRALAGGAQVPVGIVPLMPVIPQDVNAVALYVEGLGLIHRHTPGTSFGGPVALLALHLFIWIDQAALEWYTLTQYNIGPGALCLYIHGEG